MRRKQHRIVFQLFNAIAAQYRFGNQVSSVAIKTLLREHYARILALVVRYNKPTTDLIGLFSAVFKSYAATVAESVLRGNLLASECTIKGESSTIDKNRREELQFI